MNQIVAGQEHLHFSNCRAKRVSSPPILEADIERAIKANREHP